MTSSTETDRDATLHITGDPLSHTVRLKEKGPGLASKLNTAAEMMLAHPAGAPENRPNWVVPDNENLASITHVRTGFTATGMPVREAHRYV